MVFSFEIPHYPRVGRHPVGQFCDEQGIEQRSTKPAHPWTNGHVERMNRTVKEATIKRFHYETTQQRNTHLQNFLTAYNYAKRLKRLKGLTLYESFAPNGGKILLSLNATRRMTHSPMRRDHTKLDRLGRSLKHLLDIVAEFWSLRAWA